MASAGYFFPAVQTPAALQGIPKWRAYEHDLRCRIAQIQGQMGFIGLQYYAQAEQDIGQIQAVLNRVRDVLAYLEGREHAKGVPTAPAPYATAAVQETDFLYDVPWEPATETPTAPPPHAATPDPDVIFVREAPRETSPTAPTQPAEVVDLTQPAPTIDLTNDEPGEPAPAPVPDEDLTPDERQIRRIQAARRDIVDLRESTLARQANPMGIPWYEWYGKASSAPPTGTPAATKAPAKRKRGASQADARKRLRAEAPRETAPAAPNARVSNVAEPADKITPDSGYRTGSQETAGAAPAAEGNEFEFLIDEVENRETPEETPREASPLLIIDPEAGSAADDNDDDDESDEEEGSGETVGLTIIDPDAPAAADDDDDDAWTRANEVGQTMVDAAGETPRPATVDKTHGADEHDEEMDDAAEESSDELEQAVLDVFEDQPKEEEAAPPLWEESEESEEE